MHREIAVSTWSLCRHLGPIRSTRLDERGEHEFRVEHCYPEDVPLLEFGRFVRERYGLSHVELCQMHFPSSAKEYLDELRGKLAEAGCEVLNVPIDVGNISDEDEASRRHDLENVKRWMEVAAYVGSRYARVNSGRQAEGRENLSITIASYRELAAKAAELGITVLLENHGGVSAKPNNMLRLLEGVGSERFRLCPDTGNFPEEVRYQALEQLLPHAALVHVKSFEFDERGEEVRYDFPRAVRLIREFSAGAPVSVEFEGPGDQMQGVAQTVALLRRYLD